MSASQLRAFPHTTRRRPVVGWIRTAVWWTLLVAADRSVLGIEGSLAAKATPGSTNPSRVGDQLIMLEVAASAARTWSTGFRPVLDLGLG